MPKSTSMSALRLRFKWEDGFWQLQRIVSVGKMRIPPQSVQPAQHAQMRKSGFWVEWFNAKNQLCYVRAFADPIAQSIEVFHKRTPSRIESVRALNFFEVLVPELESTGVIKIYGQQISTKERSNHAIELGSFEVDKPEGKY